MHNKKNHNTLSFVGVKNIWLEKRQNEKVFWMDTNLWKDKDIFKYNFLLCLSVKYLIFIIN